jgi:RNA polymerase sigma-70 factor, ECF subfamily
MSEAGLSSFDAIMAGLDAGDQQAAQQLYERFIDRILAIAAKKLDKRLGAKVDPESVAQSVFKSFFYRHRKGELTLHNWGMVLGLLSHITFCKCVNRNRDLRAQRRDETQVVTFEDYKKAASQTGPDQEAMLSELLTLSMANFDEDEQAILNQSLAGATVDEVAQTIRLSTRTVHRVIERFRKRLESLLSEE